MLISSARYGVWWKPRQYRKSQIPDVTENRELGQLRLIPPIGTTIVRT